MITDTNSAAPRELNDESYSSIGRGGPVLEVDKVTRLYPSEPPVTALRGARSPSTRANWWASWDLGLG